MRRFAIVLGLTAAVTAAMAAPAAAQSITPGSYDWGVVDPKKASSQPLAEFQLEGPLTGIPGVISGNSESFAVSPGFCDGSLNAGQTCIFRVRVHPDPKLTGVRSAVVGVPGATATVRATIPGDSTGGSTKGKKKKCKKKGKKGAAAAKKKKGCKKKGKK